MRVVEFGDDASEDDQSAVGSRQPAAGNLELGGLWLAAEEYVGQPIARNHADQFFTVLGNRYTSPTVAELTDGTLMATI